jgi:hypothetical protein
MDLMLRDSPKRFEISLFVSKKCLCLGPGISVLWMTTNLVDIVDYQRRATHTFLVYGPGYFCVLHFTGVILDV